MPRLSIEKFLENIDSKKYLTFEDCPETLQCPECHKVMNKKSINRTFITGDCIIYSCGNPECEYQYKKII